jgi:bacteriophage protein of unknown function (DUF646)|nr:MAG TPA: putative tail-component [Caudoviricetes sp.]
MMENQAALAKFRKELEELLGDFDRSARRVVTNQAKAGIAETKKETPVGTYSNEVFFYTEWGKPVHFTTKETITGGTLKRTWKLNRTRKVGNAHVSGYSNNTPYGVYVNYGHRTVNRWGETTGWVEGRNMLEKGVSAAERKLPQLFDEEIRRVKRETGF